MGMPNSSTEGSAVDFYPYDLYRSEDPEIFAQGKKCAQLVGEIVRELRPILRHIVAPVPVLLPGVGLEGCPYDLTFRKTVVSDAYINKRERGVMLCEVKPHHRHLFPDVKEFLFLSERGEFYTARRCPDSSKQEHYHDRMDSNDGGTNTWDRAKLGMLLEALKRVLDEATQKREVYLAAIRERGDVLDKLLAVLQSQSEQSQR